MITVLWYSNQVNVYSINELGRIEMVPEVITTIAHDAVLQVAGVSQLGEPPSALFRRSTTKGISKKDGIVLEMVDQLLKFEIYILLQSNINMVDTCRAVQTAVVEAIDQMIGLPVESVNVHVTDVTHQFDENRPA